MTLARTSGVNLFIPGAADALTGPGPRGWYLLRLAGPAIQDRFRRNRSRVHSSLEYFLKSLRDGWPAKAFLNQPPPLLDRSLTQVLGFKHSYALVCKIMGIPLTH